MKTVLLVLGLAVFVHAQEFEVAAIKPSGPDTKSDFNLRPGGEIQGHNVSLKMLVSVAWGLEDDRIFGAAAWLDTEHYDIVAKAPAGAKEDDIEVMMRNLLVERFKLKVRLEDKVIPVYALAVGKRTPKLTPAAVGSPEGNCRMQAVDGVRTYVCKNMTMQGLAESLRGVASAYLDHPVIDLTEIKGAYDFSVAWTGKGYLNGTRPGVEAPAGGLTVFEAVNKHLGLDLVPRKQSMPVAVIDHAERLAADN